MVPLTKVTMSTVRSMVRVILFGLIRANTQVNSLTTILRVKAFMFGATVVSMKANGNSTKWKDMVLSRGLMVVSM